MEEDSFDSQSSGIQGNTINALNFEENDDSDSDSSTKDAGWYCDSSIAVNGEGTLNSSTTSNLRAAKSDIKVNKLPVETKSKPVADADISYNNNVFSTVAEDANKFWSKNKSGFLHRIPSKKGLLVLDICEDDTKNLGPSHTLKYDPKYFKAILPQISESQQDFCLYCRKRKNKNKFHISLNPHSFQRFRNPGYAGKISIRKTAYGRVFKVSSSRSNIRAIITLEQQDRKQILSLHMFEKNLRPRILRKDNSSTNTLLSVHSSIVQKYINPIIEIQDPGRANEVILNITKEGDTGNEKFFLHYEKPFSTFMSCCIAFAAESHHFLGE